MTEFIVLIVVSLMLAWVIQRTYIFYPNSPQTNRRNRVCYFIICIAMSFFIGLRTFYNDTAVYIASYRQSQGFPEVLEGFSRKLGDNPGFVLLNALFKTNDISHQSFLLFYSIVSVGAFIYFIKKYSNNFTLSLFLLFTTNTYLISAAAVKQSMAIAIALLGIQFAINRKWVPYIITILVAATFHPYVLIFLLVPFLMFKPWTIWTYVLVFGFISLGFTLDSLLGVIIDITTMIGDSYSEVNLVGDGINIFRVLVSNVPMILTFMYRQYIFRDSTRSENLMINMAMINGAIMFVGMFGTAIYFSRLASYFTVAQCVALPWILNKLPRKQRSFYTVAMIICYIGFFLYANVLINSFNSGFTRISFFTYISNYILG